MNSSNKHCILNFSPNTRKTKKLMDIAGNQLHQRGPGPILFGRKALILKNMPHMWKWPTLPCTILWSFSHLFETPSTGTHLSEATAQRPEGLRDSWLDDSRAKISQMLSTCPQRVKCAQNSIVHVFKLSAGFPKTQMTWLLPKGPKKVQVSKILKGSQTLAF